MERDVIRWIGLGCHLMEVVFNESVFSVRFFGVFDVGCRCCPFEMKFSFVLERYVESHRMKKGEVHK